LVQDGKTYVIIENIVSPEKVGVLGFFGPGEGNMYAMLMTFSDDSTVFYTFLASNTDLYGRYWLLDEDESPSGSGILDDN
jgi:hypothetical protein